MCTELIMWLFLDKESRSQELDVSVEKLEEHSAKFLRGPLTVGQSRAALLTVAVVVLWCTESLRGLHPAVVALLGALLATSPGYGLVSMGKALKTVPCSRLLFMAAILTLGTALVEPGVADWLACRVLGPIAGAAAGVVIVMMSTAVHLIIQSRSARSAVLIPIVVSLASGVGVDPMAAAFASIAAAGFCHTHEFGEARDPVLGRGRHRDLSTEGPAPPQCVPRPVDGGHGPVLFLCHLALMGRPLFF